MDIQYKTVFNYCDGTKTKTITVIEKSFILDIHEANSELKAL